MQFCKQKIMWKTNKRFDEFVKSAPNDFPLSQLISIFQAFSKTYIFSKFWWHIWQYTSASAIIFWVYFPFFKDISYIRLFESCWKIGFILEQLFYYSLCIASNIYFFPTCENEKDNFCGMLYASSEYVRVIKI